MDIVIDHFINNQDKFNCKIISSPKETVNICTSKLKTYEKLKDVILVPNVLTKSDIIEYPIFSKPEIGASSRGTVKINNDRDLEYWSNVYPNNLLLEYLPGDEYTIDCFTDKKRNLLFVGPRKRSRITNGISTSTTMVKDSKLFELATKLNNELIFNGSWFFQVKKNNLGEYCLMEIASRFGGSSVIHRLLGVNFSYLNILNELYDNIQIRFNDFNIQVDRSLDIKTKIDSFK
jgi:carbamoylphosphate synthase large subunit